MIWFVVAKKDFRDVVQSRVLWAIVAVFVVLSVLSTYAYGNRLRHFEVSDSVFDARLDVPRHSATIPCLRTSRLL